MLHPFLELIRDIFSFKDFGFVWAIIAGVAFFILKSLVQNPAPGPPGPAYPATPVNKDGMGVKTETRTKEELLEAAKNAEKRNEEKKRKDVYSVLVVFAIITAIVLLYILLKRSG